MFDSREQAWVDLKIYLDGQFVVGARGISDKTTSEDEHLYAAGNEPIAIQPGNRKYEGSLMLLKSEVDKMNDGARNSGFKDVADVSGWDIVCTYAPTGNQRLRTRSYKFVKFTEFEMALKQGEKFMEVTLPFLCLGIVAD